MEPTPPVVATLRVETSRDDFYLDLVEFRLAIDVPHNLSSGSGGVAPRAQIENLEFVALSAPELSRLHRVMARGSVVSVTVSVPDPGGSRIPLQLARANVAVASRLAPSQARNDLQQNVFEGAFALADLTLFRDTHEVRYDQVAAQASCIDSPCGCGSNPVPPRYVHADGFDLQPATGTYEVDWFTTGSEVNVNLGSLPGGGSTGPLRDQGLFVRKDFDDDAICLYERIARAAHLDHLVLDQAFTAQSPGGYLADYTYEYLCRALPTRLEIFSDASGRIKSESRFIGGAQRLTFRSYDAQGVLLESESSMWSFVLNNDSGGCW
ncbi:hypothetical protein [Lujinxingia vulgaris]|nr:hypothetical protein [Lujinxingia vulgaris]